MKPVKKAKVRQARVEEIKDLFDPKAQRKWERDWQNELIDLEERVEENYKYAWEVFKLQDEPTKQALREAVKMMAHMAGEPTFRFRGRPVVEDMARLRAVQERNFLWIAVRLFVACGEWEMQIANFKIPAGKCARCLKPTKG
jgi:hypothetical protein